MRPVAMELLVTPVLLLAVLSGLQLSGAVAAHLMGRLADPPRLEPDPTGTLLVAPEGRRLLLDLTQDSRAAPAADQF